MDTFPYSIRPINPEDDSADIARLIRVSFAPWLDKENLDYLDKLEKEGLRYQDHPFWASLISFSYPQAGVVCTDGRGGILGLINNYNFHLNDELCSLLANICVDPDHRREGIASRMLAEIEKKLFSEGVLKLFLQARVGAPETIRFYRARGFSVTDYRETRILPAGEYARRPETRTTRLERVPGSDMETFIRLMRIRYPSSILWNLHYHKELFQAGMAAEIRNRMDSFFNCFRRIIGQDGRVRAWAAYQSLKGSADQVWMVPNEGISLQDQKEALNTIAACWGGNRPLKLDLPAGVPGEAFADTGFVYQQTLAWMWKKL